MSSSHSSFRGVFNPMSDDISKLNPLNSRTCSQCSHYKACGAVKLFASSIVTNFPMFKPANLAFICEEFQSSEQEDDE